MIENTMGVPLGWAFTGLAYPFLFCHPCPPKKGPVNEHFGAGHLKHEEEETCKSQPWGCSCLLRERK